MSEKRYLVQNESAGYVGNAPMWWKAGGTGYTPAVHEAERFTLDEASRRVEDCVGSHRMKIWHEADVMNAGYFVADIQMLAKKCQPFCSSCGQRIPEAKGGAA